MIHELPLERRTLHGHFSRELEPVLAIDPGDSVRFATPNAGWFLESGERFAEHDPELDNGHALAGPIEVRGARAGHDARRPDRRGQARIVGRHVRRRGARGPLGARRTASAAAPGRACGWPPFLGVLGMPPPEPGLHSTAPPRPCGGNIDCKELVAGTTLFLPIPVEGALFSAGDGHAAQGDGEVSGTAIECPVEAQVTLDLREDLRLEWPIARIDGAWLTFGFDEHLGRAARIAVDGMLELMQREHELSARDALALASVVVDLRVTQVVNGALGVHAVLRDDAFLAA